MAFRPQKSFPIGSLAIVAVLFIQQGLACVDTSPACIGWKGLCNVPGVSTYCPCMCGSNGGSTSSTSSSSSSSSSSTTGSSGSSSNGCGTSTSSSTSSTSSSSSTSTSSGPGCTDTFAACPGWAGQCGSPGVAQYCPCMCGGTRSRSLAVTSSAGGCPPAPNAQFIAYWRWTWGQGATPPSGANAGIAFSGWTDPNSALSDSANVQLQGTRYISLGGGNGNGRFTAASLQAITAAIKAGKFQNYGGIAFDIEEGDAGLANAFKTAISAAKAKSKKVIVTISHSAPYGITDAASLMRSFFPNADIDYLSPQLYTGGQESSNDYATTYGVQWSEYAKAKAKVVPSIVSARMYNDAATYFKSQGVTLNGYIQWSQS